MIDDFPRRSEYGLENAYNHIKYLHIYNPFYPIQTISTTSQQFTTKQLTRKNGFVLGIPVETVKNTSYTDYHHPDFLYIRIDSFNSK